MIEVMYSCNKCGIKRRSVFVIPRSPREDVVQFVDRAALQVKADHDTQSPSCEIDHLDELMIPVEDGKPIGAEPKKQ